MDFDIHTHIHSHTHTQSVDFVTHIRTYIRTYIDTDYAIPPHYRLSTASSIHMRAQNHRTQHLLHRVEADVYIVLTKHTRTLNITLTASNAGPSTPWQPLILISANLGRPSARALMPKLSIRTHPWQFKVRISPHDFDKDMRLADETCLENTSQARVQHPCCIHLSGSFCSCTRDKFMICEQQIHARSLLRV